VNDGPTALQARWLLAIEAGAMGCWEWDVAARRAYFSARQFELLGMTPTPDGYVDAAAIISTVHPDERAAFEAELAAAVRSETDAACEFRIVHPRLGVRWLAVRARRLPVAGRLGDVLTGLSWDVTERRQHDEEQGRLADGLRLALALLNGGEQNARVGSFVDRLDQPAGLVWSDTMYELLGVDKSRPPDRAESFSMYPPDVRRVLEEAVASTLRAGQSVQLEVPLEPAPGRARWVRVALFPRMENGRCIEVCGSVHDISERKALEASLVDAASVERQRIGAELHDDLGQVLTGAAFQLSALKTALSRLEHPTLAERCSDIESLLQTARDSCRKLAHGYVAPHDLSALVARLRVLVSELPPPWVGTLQLDIEHKHVSDPLPQELFRIAQEALTNAVRHSGGARLEVHLTIRGPHVRLAVRDDGVGLPYGTTAALGGGLGIGNMRMRAARIGGIVTLKAGIEGRGTSIDVLVPAGRHLAPAPGSETLPAALHLEWHAAYESGDATIDAQHQELFRIANRLLEAASAHDRAESVHMHELLLEHLERHFATEEALLTRIGYAEVGMHSALHAELLEEARKIGVQVAEGHRSLGDLIGFSLSRVLTDHLLHDDFMFFGALRGQTARTAGADRAS
jgi:hemerythrin-like metal-binding protein